MKRPKAKSVLSLDVGKKRIGLAGCDPLGITVTRLKPLIRKDFESDLNVINQLCKNRKVEGLVIGLPFGKSGEKTIQGKFCMEYGLRIANALNLPIAWVNEHSSTWQAKANLKLHSDRSGKIDSEAAGLLLEQWLIEGPELSLSK
ncbi:Holliday junction resolvase RuvX [Prochlorococcus sp. MIT 1223]|uniref:Holliday junction resolvase RuvX n=1 Tax=Prochlorococcus sp. MIT 1223 TaxID=3096217 RepID=UPI002A74918F|nr:Holliday junction resolvase RuvX [Prochlorococcus sp. MIT 1223]